MLLRLQQFTKWLETREPNGQEAHFETAVRQVNDAKIERVFEKRMDSVKLRNLVGNERVLIERKVAKKEGRATYLNRLHQPISIA